MPVAVFIIALALLVRFDPAGLYTPPAYQPPTAVEQLQNEWWADQMAADISTDNATHDAYLAEQRRVIVLKSNHMGIDPKQVFGEEN